MKAFQLRILTPGGNAFEDRISALIAPGSEGSFGVMASHSPIVNRLKAGYLQVTNADLIRFYVINAGILEVNPKGDVLILTDDFISAKNREDAGQKLSELIFSNPDSI